jgi:hypothetical protein
VDRRRQLPADLVLTSNHDCGPLRDYLELQIAAGSLGRQVGLDRLLDWLLVCTMRD